MHRWEMAGKSLMDNWLHFSWVYENSCTKLTKLKCSALYGEGSTSLFLPSFLPSSLSLPFPFLLIRTARLLQGSRSNATVMYINRVDEEVEWMTISVEMRHVSNRIHEIGCLVAQKSKLPKMMASEEDKYCEPDG